MRAKALRNFPREIPREIPCEFQPLPKRLNPNLRPIHARRRFFRNILAQAPKQGKCKRRPEQVLKPEKQKNDGPRDHGENGV